MPRKIGNTTVPRNHVARALTERRGGAHQKSQTAERQSTQARVRELTEDWREDVAFELSVKVKADGEDD